MDRGPDLTCSDQPPPAGEELQQSLLHAERQIARLRTLQEISHKLNSQLDLEDLLANLLDEAIRAVGAERGCLFLVNAATGQLELHSGRRLRPSDLNAKPFRLSQTVIQRVWREGRPVLTANAAQDPDLAKANSVVRYTLRSILCVPLQRQEQRIGVLYLDNRLKVGQFEEDHLALVVAIADQAALALQNLQLSQKAQQELAERVRSEEALRESEEKFRTIAEQSSNMIFINQHGAVVYANQKCEEVMGYKREEFYEPDFDFLSLIAPESQDLVKANFRRHMQGEDVLPYEYAVITKEGSSIETIIATKLIRYAGESAILGVVTDITERKRAEEQLGLLSSAVQQSSEGIAISDLEGNLLFVNNAFAAMHGYTSEEIVGEHLSIFHTPEQMPAVETANRQIQETGVFSGEVWHARRDGTVFPTLMHNSLLRDERGLAVGMIGTLRDISEWVQARDVLSRRNRELELLNHAIRSFTSTLHLDQVLATALEQVRFLLDVTGASIWLIDPETGELVCRQAAGSGSQVEYGWRLAPDQGLAGWVAARGESLIVPDTYADKRFFKGINQKTGLEIRSVLCVPLRAKQDVTGVIYVADTRIDRFGSADLRWVEALASAAGIAIENARLHAREHQLIVERERHRLARELHDTVTQSLHSIGMAAQTALRLLGQATAHGKVRDAVEHIQATSQTALAEMRDQLYDLYPTALSASGLVEALAKHCAVLREQYSLDVTLTAGQEPPMPVSQRETLYYIAREACWNIVKYARATRVDVRLESEGDTITLSVMDDGTGFDPSLVAGGETMGLRAMRERAELLGGTFELDSQPGRGTRATVRIPVF